MKKILLISAITIFSLFIMSCEEDFNPKTEYKERFILNCIVRGDTTLQYATLLKSYSIPGFDPYENRVDPFLEGADIRIWHQDDVYFLRDTVLVRDDTSRYNTPINCYYLSGFRPGETEELEIKAILPTGKTLVGKTKLPDYVTFSSASDFIIPSDEKDNFAFLWSGENNIGWYLTRFSIYYSKKENGVDVFYSKEVPTKYVLENGKWNAKYPVPSRSTAVGFLNSALDSAFAQISAGDENKSNYTIRAGVLELLIFDENLSKYYSSINGFLDQFTVRVDETDYTNIEGGFGIFGSYIKQNRSMRFETSYVQSFGYTPINP